MRFEDINENLEALRAGDIVGRAVVTFGYTAAPSVSASEQDTKSAAKSA